jgi:hypothetical protein
VLRVKGSRGRTPFISGLGFEFRVGGSVGIEFLV